MPKIAYANPRLGAARLATIDRANTIIAEYAAQNLTLTLRQLYYQFVARGLIANRQTEYTRLGETRGEGRMAGLVDWNAIEDRTRNPRLMFGYDGPADLIGRVANAYKRDRWEQQENHVEVWVEKEALAAVVENVCRELDVSSFACRGYTSLSEMWRAGQRLRSFAIQGRKPVILHLGDHDPSGIDMSRDIEERIGTFLGARYSLTFERVALNMDQVLELNPPPNPAKLTDSRSTGYIERFGDESWELDAIPPDRLATLIREAVGQYRDDDAFNAVVETENAERESIQAVTDRWDDVVAFIAEEDQ